MSKPQLKINDFLAIDRTHLANERTFLAYFRTFVVFLSSGFAVLKLEMLKEILIVGYFLVVLAPILLIIGVLRFYITKKRIGKYYQE